MKLFIKKLFNRFLDSLISTPVMPQNVQNDSEWDTYVKGINERLALLESKKTEK